MIAYVDTPPTIEPSNGGFLVTFTSGATETQLHLTMHALASLCGLGGVKLKQAQIKLESFEPTPFAKKRGGTC